MRVWDIPPEQLCRKHLLGEHRELHAIWSILTNGLEGYSNHPETKRWKGKLKALNSRHNQLKDEMECRGYNHASPLDKKLATGKEKQSDFVNTLAEQNDILNAKDCNCNFEQTI